MNEIFSKSSVDCKVEEGLDQAVHLNIIWLTNFKGECVYIATYMEEWLDQAVHLQTSVTGEIICWNIVYDTEYWLWLSFYTIYIDINDINIHCKIYIGEQLDQAIHLKYNCQKKSFPENFEREFCLSDNCSWKRILANLLNEFRVNLKQIMLTTRVLDFVDTSYKGNCLSEN